MVNASSAAAGARTCFPDSATLPGFRRGRRQHRYIYGAHNLITWPFSILWGVSRAAIDANTINERELLYHDQYNMPQDK